MVKPLIGLSEAKRVRDNQQVDERLMDPGDLQKSAHHYFGMCKRSMWDGTRVNIIDMQATILVVRLNVFGHGRWCHSATDAAEGPMHKPNCVVMLKQGLKPIVIINKVTSYVEEVVDEADLFVALMPMKTA